MARPDLPSSDDSRLVRGAPDRLQDAEPRAPREERSRPVSEERTITDQERLDLLRMSYFSDQLPVMPPMPGFHTCWLTTTNPRDTVAMRLRLGYELVKASEITGFAELAINEGAYKGCVMVNEMILSKLPNRLYQMFMAEVHHTQPYQQEETIKAQIESLSEGARGKKSRLMVEEGMQDFMQQHRPSPNFLKVAPRVRVVEQEVVDEEAE